MHFNSIERIVFCFFLMQCIAVQLDDDLDRDREVQATVSVRRYSHK